MNKNTKIFLGVLTFLPIPLILFYFISFFNMIASIEAGNEAVILNSFVGLFGTMAIAALLTFGLMIYYIIHVNQQKENDSNDRLLWTLVLIFAGGIGTILYWILKIWPEEKSLEEPQADIVLDEDLI